jgi:ribonucleoside-diphosphate reductase alpha chain
MRGAKSGQWWLDEPQRALANNSAVYTQKPTFEFFLDEMKALYESKSGERGMFSRVACQQIASRNGRREAGVEFGTNPCSEIILRPNQFCNLSEVVVRSDDTLASLKTKVGQATILGTLQATLTDFRYLRKVWKTNTEEEALLGVSLTGIMDHPVMGGREEPGTLESWLEELKQVAIDVNKKWAKRLGVAQSAAITCVKPSGTVSQLVNSASGIHPRFSPFYTRTVRMDKKDPLARFMSERGFPVEDDIHNTTNFVFSFPVAGPPDSVAADEVGAMEQLRLWKTYQDYWCEHKPSITVYYRDDEFLEVAQWCWKNFDSLSGIALLPYSEHTYQQAPYQAISEQEYEEAKAAMPTLDFSDLAVYESEDMTTGSQELACVGGACELPEL